MKISFKFLEDLSFNLALGLTYLFIAVAFFTFIAMLLTKHTLVFALVTWIAFWDMIVAYVLHIFIIIFKRLLKK